MMRMTFEMKNQINVQSFVRKMKKMACYYKTKVVENPYIWYEKIGITLEEAQFKLKTHGMR